MYQIRNHPYLSYVITTRPYISHNHQTYFSYSYVYNECEITAYPTDATKYGYALLEARASIQSLIKKEN